MVAGARTFSLQETLVGPQALKPPPTRHALLSCLIVLAAVLHIGTAGWGDLYSESEGQYAGGAREMLHSHDWLLPTNDGIPQLQKPPALYWIIAASFKVFGVSPAAARIPTAIAMVTSIALTFLIGERLFDYWRGFLAGLVHLCLLGAFLLGRVVMPAPVFSALMAGAILCAVRGYGERRSRALWFLGFWICCALAALTNGVDGLLYPAVICGSLAIVNREARIRFRKLLWWPYLLLFLGFVLPWYLCCEQRFPGFLMDLCRWNWRAAADIPRLHFLMLHLVWWFPAAPLILPGLTFATRRIFRPHEFDFADAVPLCWMGAMMLALLLPGQRQDSSSMGMWGGFALFTVTAWDRIPLRLRVVGISSVVVLGMASAATALLLPTIAANSATEWTDARIRSTAWNALQNIPFSAWLSFRPMFALIAVSLLIGGAIAIYLVVTHRERAALAVVLAAMLPIGLSAAEAVGRMSPYFSLAGAARFLNERQTDSDSVFFEGALQEASSLLFYTQRDILLVNQEARPLEVRTSDLQKFFREDALLRRWSATDPVYLIVEQSRVPYWRSVLTARVHIYHQVATCGSYVVLSNQL